MHDSNNSNIHEGCFKIKRQRKLRNEGDESTSESINMNQITSSVVARGKPTENKS